MATSINVNEELCKKDGLCASVCPTRIFVWEKKELPRVRAPEECCWCGQCMAVCPSGAIEHSRLDAGNMVKIENRSPVEVEAFTAFLRQRRSVRVYKDRPLDRELVEKVCMAAGYAPTGAFQGTGWVRKVTVVSGERMKEVNEATVEYMRKLGKLLGGAFMKMAAKFSDSASGGMLTLPDIKMRLAEWEQGRDAITYGAPAAVFVSASSAAATPREDCDAALMNILLMAQAHGLGTCWNGWLGHAATGDHVSGGDALGKLLGLPEDHKIVEAATLGWPGIKLHSVPWRETEVRWIE